MAFVVDLPAVDLGTIYSVYLLFVELYLFDYVLDFLQSRFWSIRRICLVVLQLNHSAWFSMKDARFLDVAWFVCSLSTFASSANCVLSVDTNY